MRGFSWKRALGVTKVKQKVARATGVPTTKQGRKRKAQRLVFGWLFGGTSRRSSSSDGRQAQGCGCGTVLTLLVVLPLTGFAAMCVCPGIVSMLVDGDQVAQVDDEPAIRDSIDDGGLAGQEVPPAAVTGENGEPAATDGNEVVEEPPEIETEQPARVESPPVTDGGWREWVDASGAFRIRAKFRSYGSGLVKLEREDGSVIGVPIGRLCEDDREFIRSKF